MTAPRSADENLLCGILALQMDFVSRDQLIEAMNAWVLQKATPLADLLQRKGWLADEDRELLHRMVRRHIARHDHAPRLSLQAAGIDPALRTALSRLGDADIASSLAPLGTIGPDDAWVTVPPPPPTAAGRTRFRRLRPHARGGLGEVFVAEDEELRREVALKEIQSQYADHPAARARFVREAEVTGQLEHPGVVPIYGLGAYPDGRPYYAMRFIRGESMHDAIKRFHGSELAASGPPGERTLELRRLLGHFVAVCNAVAYAHSRGVIHRDLKPANVMLGEFGETLVVDWGLARLLTETDATRTTAERPVTPGGDGETTPTRMGEVVGTPAYMPPEQAGGRLDQVGPASDQFSLGATLYELLSGRPPYLGSDALQRAERAVVAPPRQVHRGAPAALESICLRAMAARPGDRYGSVRELAREVERWLGDEAVEAHRDSLLDRARRWSRRHRVAVSSLGVLLVAGVIGLGTGLYAVGREKAETDKALDTANTNLQAARVNLARAERAEADANDNLKRSEENLKLAKAAVDECFGVARGHPILQRDDMAEVKRLLLDKAKPFYRNFQALRRGDRAIDREAATHFVHLGDIEENAGAYDAAVKLYRQAIDAYAALARGDGAGVEDRYHLAEARYKLGTVYYQAGYLSDATASYRRAIAGLEDIQNTSPPEVKYQLALAEAHLQFTQLLMEDGDLTTAIHSSQQARRLYDHLLERHGVNQRVVLGLMWSRIRMMLLETARGPKADYLITTMRESARVTAIIGRTKAKFIENPEMFAIFAPQMLEVLEEILRRGGPTTTMTTLVGGVQQTYAKMVNQQLGNHALQRGLARASYRHGLTLDEGNDSAKALAAFQQARDIQTRLLAARPTSELYKRELALTLVELGYSLERTNKQKEGVAACQDACRMAEELVAASPHVLANHYTLAATRKRHADLLQSTGRHDAAVAMYQRAINSTAALAPRFRSTYTHFALYVACYDKAAWSFRQLRRYEDALRAYQHVRALRLSSLHSILMPGYDELWVALGHSNVCDVAYRLRRWPLCETTARAAIKVYLELHRNGKQTRYSEEQLLDVCDSRATALRRLDRPDDAVGVWDEVIAVSGGPFRDSLRVRRAETLARLGRYQAAVAEAVPLLLPRRADPKAAALNGDDRYSLACALALCSRAASRDRLAPLPVRERLEERYAVLAVGQLRRADELGHFRKPSNKAQLDRDFDFDLLRHRDDYKRFHAAIRTAAK